MELLRSRPNVKKQQIPATVATNIFLRPGRSQVVLVASIVLAGICLLAGFAFLRFDPWLSFVPFGFAIILIVLTAWGWLHSQADVDMANSAPASISADSDLVRIQFDPRTLNNKFAIDNLCTILSNVVHREPLPEPDGIVDSSGRPLPDSREDAASRVREINAETQKMAALVLEKLPTRPEAASVPQIAFEQPRCEAVVTTNKIEEDPLH
jgi:hypothetical protein